MTTRRQLQNKPQGKHRPQFITPYVSLFGIPQGGFHLYRGNYKLSRVRKLTVEDIYKALMEGPR